MFKSIVTININNTSGINENLDAAIILDSIPVKTGPKFDSFTIADNCAAKNINTNINNQNIEVNSNKIIPGIEINSNGTNINKVFNLK